jgi:hypothetical protein
MQGHVIYKLYMSQANTLSLSRVPEAEMSVKIGVTGVTDKYLKFISDLFLGQKLWLDFNSRYGIFVAA